MDRKSCMHLRKVVNTTFHGKKRKKTRKTLKNGICNIIKRIFNNFETENQWP